MADGGITFTMLWDESFQSWVELEVRGQPAARLFSADGAPLASWSGIFDQDEALRLIET